MSYPPLSNYYASSDQSSRNTNNAYPSSANSGTYAYSGSVTGSSGAQPAAYGSSVYSYAAHNSYSSQSSVRQRSDPYGPRVGHRPQTSNNYDGQDSSPNDAYSQNYYGRHNTGHAQRQAATEGLSNLAHAAGVNASDKTLQTPQNPQQYDRSTYRATQQLGRDGSPVTNRTSYSTNPPTSANSYSLQQRTSPSSTSSQQLAINAAAALAGAVSRRYPNQQNNEHLVAPPQTVDGDSAVSNPQCTASPQTNTVSHGQKQQQMSHSTQHQHPTGSSYSPPNPQTGDLRISNPSRNSARHASTASTQNVQHHQSSPPPNRSIQQSGSIANLISTAHEPGSQHGYAQASGTQDAAPTFIDPTAVFDPYHRERKRKKIEAAAEVRRKAEEGARAEENRKQRDKDTEQRKLQARQAEAEAQKQPMATKSAPTSAKKTKPRTTALPPSSGPAAAPATATLSEEEVMAAELKAMMDKMKAFQNKDPSLFKKLLNDMKQPNHIQVGNTVQSSSPQIAAQVLSVSTSSDGPASIQHTSVSNTPSQATSDQLNQSTTGRRKVAQVGPDGNKLHLNGFPVIVENNTEGLPDLGRFPAERRIRLDKYRKRNKSGSAGIAISASPQATTQPIAAPASASPRASGTPNPTASVGQLSTSATSTISKEETRQKPSSGTVWPLEKRNALTATALKALKANPENATIPLTEDDLHKILEHNPSYMTLCENLEQRGLKFHRGQFARELLNSVPELKTPGPMQNSTPTPTPQPAQPVSVATAGLTVQHNATVPPTPSPYGFQPHGYPPPQPPPGYMVQYHNTAVSQVMPAPSTQYGQGVAVPVRPALRPPVSTNKQSYPRTPFSRPEPPPGSKEAAARKRDFSELIDLTELGDDENYVMPDKHPRLEGSDSDFEIEDNPIQAFQKKVQDSTPLNRIENDMGRLAPKRDHLQFQHQSLQEPKLLNASAKKLETAVDTKGQRVMLAKTLDKSEALKKQYYDPKTVARDILIASGRHPSERPLNVHLAGMLGKYIELDSDVSTFEWNEIDPGGPPVPKVELVDIPATRPRFKLGDRINSKRDKPRSSVIDKTRQPEKEKRTNIDTLAPRSTPNAATSLSSHPQPARLKNSSSLRHSLLASDEQATPATLDPTRPPQVESDRLSPLRRTSIAKENPKMEEKVKRKPGRPPGSKNKYPTVGGLRNQASEAVGVRINVPPREPTPGRERFKCKWKKCSTVLHNLDTLRKHIGRLHCPSREEVAKEGYTCWWKKCKFLKQDENNDWITTKVFEHREDWLRHIEREHVSPIAMKFGDGPSMAHVDPLIIKNDRATYCADDKNHEVTPIIHDQFSGNEHYPSDVLNLTEIPPPDMTAHALTDKQKSEKFAHLAYLKAHDLGKDTRAASREVIRAMEKRKEKIGPGIDRGGCTLINQEMREIFVQNPGIRRVVAFNE